MQQEIFADTGYYLALHLHTDDLHAIASETGRRGSRTSRIITSDFIEIETLNALSKENPKVKDFAVWYFGEMRADPGHLVIPATRGLLQRAEELYLKRSDNSWSLVDCSSFIIMRDRGIHEALANDRHFEQAGFIALLR